MYDLISCSNDWFTFNVWEKNILIKKSGFLSMNRLFVRAQMMSKSKRHFTLITCIRFLTCNEVNQILYAVFSIEIERIYLIVDFHLCVSLNAVWDDLEFWIVYHNVSKHAVEFLDEPHFYAISKLPKLKMTYRIYRMHGSALLHRILRVQIKWLTSIWMLHFVRKILSTKI